jgi:hypothetical protein
MFLPVGVEGEEEIRPGLIFKQFSRQNQLWANWLCHQAHAAPGSEVDV